MRTLKQTTATNLMVVITQSADHVTGLTGATLTITASKDGAAFAGIAPTVTERGTGWYSLALTGPMTDTLGDLALHITAASADPTDVTLWVTARPFDDLSTLTQANILSDATPFAGANIALIQAKTTNLPASPAAVGSNMGTVSSVTGSVAGDVAGKIIGGGASAMTAAGVRAVDSVSGAALALDSTVAKSATAVSNADLTPTRAAKLDNLDAAVSTRATPAQVATELATYDAPTKAEMDAGFAALNDLSVADILAGVIDGAWDVGATLKEVLAYVSGDVAKAADAYTYKDRSGVGVFTNTVTLTARTRS